MRRKPSWTDAPGMNRTCARGLGTSVPKRHLQAKHPLNDLCAPVIAPLRDSDSLKRRARVRPHTPTWL